MSTSDFECDLECCPCPLCGSDVPQSSPYRREGFAIVRCGHCRLWYLSPRLNEDKMASHYAQDDYFEGDGSGYDSYTGQERSLRATFRGLVKRLAKKDMVGGSLLEIGCGYGYFLEEAAPYFDFRAGTELSPPAAAQARLRSDLICQGGIEAIPEKQKFDLIVAWHVIEHIYDPIAFLEQIKQHLKDGGRCVLAAPDMGSFWRKAMGRHWPSFKYPEHVVFYDSQSLSRLMQDAGLRTVETVPYPHAFPFADICKKLRLPVIPGLGSWNIWLPATTVAMAGRMVGDKRT